MASYVGGGFASVNSTPSFCDCLFFENNSTSFGGAVSADELSESVYFIECNFTSNQARFFGGVIYRF